MDYNTTIHRQYVEDTGGDVFERYEAVTLVDAGAYITRVGKDVEELQHRFEEDGCGKWGYGEEVEVVAEEHLEGMKRSLGEEVEELLGRDHLREEAIDPELGAVSAHSD